MIFWVFIYFAVPMTPTIQVTLTISINALMNIELVPTPVILPIAYRSNLYGHRNALHERKH